MANTDGGATQPPVTYCPVLGMNFLPQEIPSAQILRGGQAEVQFAPMMSKCVEAQCRMWDGARKECTIKLGAESLVALAELAKKHEGKLGLFGMFGKKA